MKKSAKEQKTKQKTLEDLYRISVLLNEAVATRVPRLNPALSEASRRARDEIAAKWLAVGRLTPMRDLARGSISRARETLPPEIYKAVESELKREIGPTFLSLVSSDRRTLERVLRRGQIRTEHEGRIVKDALDDGSAEEWFPDSVGTLQRMIVG